MPDSSSEKLYSPRLLALSASLADFPLNGPFTRTAEARSQTCGSAIELGIELDISGTVSRIGMQVSACAVGQSSAAIMANELRGKSPDEISATTQSIALWLAGEGDLPDWPGFDALIPARDFAGRHQALLLPWKAINDALSSGETSG